MKNHRAATVVVAQPAGPEVWAFIEELLRDARDPYTGEPIVVPNARRA